MPVTLSIDDLGVGGEGIGRFNGLTVFVPGALPQDRVEIDLVEQKKHYAYGRTLRTVAASPLRTVPRCLITDRCGGCQIQGLDYRAQLLWKQKKVQDSFKHVAKLNPLVLATLGMGNPYGYRNKAQFVVGHRGHQIETGFYALASHSVVDTDHCPVQDPLINQALLAIRKFLRLHPVSIYNEARHQGLLRHILIRCGLRTQQLMVCLVINGSQIPNGAAWVQDLKRIPQIKSIGLNINTRRGSVILGPQTKILWGQDYIEDTLGQFTFRISPLSFYQINPVQTEVLYQKAVEFAELTGREQVWDLYCGVGALTLFLAQRARHVCGIDETSAAVADAKANARRNRIGNVEFFCGKVEYRLPRILKQNRQRMDVIVLDPPRKGCEAGVLRAAAAMEPQRMVYVSCDPSTLARDAAVLAQLGYGLRMVQPIDMFPHTIHVECVALLEPSPGA